jgi:hypothetical protein
VVALTAASAASSLATMMMDDQGVIERITWAERQRALPSAQAAGAVAAALAERDRLAEEGQLQVGRRRQVHSWSCVAVCVCLGGGRVCGCALGQGEGGSVFGIALRMSWQGCSGHAAALAALQRLASKHAAGAAPAR